MKRTMFLFGVALLTLALVVGCGNGTSAPTSAPATIALATDAPATNAPAQATGAPQAENTETPGTSDAAETVTLMVVSDKSEARYKIREQLANVSLPNDAIGRTNAVTGQIVGSTDGTIDATNSQVVVDVRTLTSDQGMRDNFIQRTPLQTSQYPNVTFVPTSAPGLPLLVPDSGSATFQLIGDLTIRDVTLPTTWEATCNLTVGQTEGLCKATTTFTFNDFQLEQPRVGRVLSIEDDITLEVDLYLQRVTQ